MQTLVTASILKCHTISEEDAINYFKSNTNLSPIEGFWTVNCNTILLNNNSIIDTDFNANLSTWAIVRQDNTFYVCDYGKNDSQQMNFKAHFSENTESGVFDYFCDFLYPKWDVDAKAILLNDSIISYSYFVDDKTYNFENSEKTLWSFTWTKLL